MCLLYKHYTLLELIKKKKSWAHFGMENVHLEIGW